MRRLFPDVEGTELKAVDRDGEDRSAAIVVAELLRPRDLLALEQADHIGRGPLGQDEARKEGEHCGEMSHGEVLLEGKPTPGLRPQGAAYSII